VQKKLVAAEMNKSPAEVAAVPKHAVEPQN